MVDQRPDRTGPEPTGPDPTSPDPVRRRSRSFGPTVLLGLGGGVLAAVAGSRPWAEVDGSSADSALQSIAAAATASTDASAPPVTAFALVVLAAWGVVLVARGRSRRVVTWLGAAAALATLGFALAAYVAAPGVVRDAFASYQLTDLTVGRTAWSVVGVAAALVAVVAAMLAVRAVRTWPEMGRRYDSPTGAAERPAAPAAAEDQSSLDLWKALDEGRDPTAPRDH